MRGSCRPGDVTAPVHGRLRSAREPCRGVCGAPHGFTWRSGGAAPPPSLQGLPSLHDVSTRVARLLPTPRAAGRQHAALPLLLVIQPARQPRPPRRWLGGSKPRFLHVFSHGVHSCLGKDVALMELKLVRGAQSVVCAPAESRGITLHYYYYYYYIIAIIIIITLLLKLVRGAQSVVCAPAESGGITPQGSTRGSGGCPRKERGGGEGGEVGNRGSACCARSLLG